MKLLIEQEKLNKTRIGQEILRNAGVVTKRALEYILKEYDLFDDGCGLTKLFSRLEREDAVLNGWVIFSYPVECIYDLGEAMASTNILPNRTVVFQIRLDNQIERDNNIVSHASDAILELRQNNLFIGLDSSLIRLRMMKIKSISQAV